MHNGKYIKCTKCKRFSYELSKEEYIKLFKKFDNSEYSCLCGNTSFVDVTKEEEKALPDGVTVSILVKP